MRNSEIKGISIWLVNELRDFLTNRDPILLITLHQNARVSNMENSWIFKFMSWGEKVTNMSLFNKNNI